MLLLDGMMRFEVFDLNFELNWIELTKIIQYIEQLNDLKLNTSYYKYIMII